MKYFYKIENGKLIKGSGIKVPTGFTEYSKDNLPSDFMQLQNEELLAKTKQDKIKALKKTRNILVNDSVVKLKSGEELNGNEKAQDRLSAILQTSIMAIDFIDAYNNTVTLDRSKLSEALDLAVNKQSEIYIKFNSLRTKVNECGSIEEVDKIVWEA